MSPSQPMRERRTQQVLLGCAVALVLAGAVTTWGQRDATTPPSEVSVSSPPRATPVVTPAPASAKALPAPPPAPSTGTTRPSRALTRPRPPGRPVRLLIPSLGVDAPVVEIVDDDRALLPPADPQVLGWWAPGARPGAPTGSALITGHTVHAGGGALDDLGDLEPRDRVEVLSDRMRMPYVVRKVRVFHKGRLLTEAARLFDQDVQGRLVIITCADWNGQEYLSNVVVTAVPRHTPAYLARHRSRAARLAPSVVPRSWPRRE